MAAGSRCSCSTWSKSPTNGLSPSSSCLLCVCMLRLAPPPCRHDPLREQHVQLTSLLRVCRRALAAPQPNREASGAGSSRPRSRSRAEGLKTLRAGARPPAARRLQVQVSHAAALRGAWSGTAPCTGGLLRRRLHGNKRCTGGSRI